MQVSVAFDPCSVCVKQTLVSIWVALALSALGCTPTEKGVDQSQCYEIVGSTKLFMGSQECLMRLPQEEVHGYWVSDHEYSVFYSRRELILPSHDKSAIWLEFSNEVRTEIDRFLVKGTRQIFEIRFIGSVSRVPGLYGSGDFVGGAIVKRVLDIKEIQIN